MYFPLTESEQKFISNIFSQYVIVCLMNERVELCWASVVDIIFVGRYLQQYMNPGYRYIRHQKSKSSHRSTSFNHDTSQSKKKTMQSSELESGLPDEAEQECIVFSFLEAVEN